MKKKHLIRFIFFSVEKGERFNQILGFAKTLFPADEISIHSEVTGFSNAIVEPGFDQRITLILAGSSHDLTRILPFRDLFENRFVILILPDSEKETVDKALTLYPRYIDYVQNDPSGIYLVLKKLVQKIHGLPGSEKKSKDKK